MPLTKIFKPVGIISTRRNSDTNLSRPWPFEQVFEIILSRITDLYLAFFFYMAYIH